MMQIYDVLPDLSLIFVRNNSKPVSLFIAMKKIGLFLLTAIVLFSCTNKKNIPDVSGIKADLTAQRFDRDFFGIDTVNIEQSLSALQIKYPDFLPLFLQNIVGVNDANGLRTYC